MYVGGVKVDKTDEKTIENLTEHFRIIQKQDMFDNPEQWKQMSRENKAARRREAIIKIRKQMQRDEIKSGQLRESTLINRKLREINDETACRYKNYIIHLKRQRRVLTNKQLELCLQ